MVCVADSKNCTIRFAEKADSDKMMSKNNETQNVITKQRQR